MFTFVSFPLMLKGTRIVQLESGSDSDSESRHKGFPLFNGAGTYSGGRLRRVDANTRSRMVCRNDILILVSYSIGHRHAK